MRMSRDVTLGEGTPVSSWGGHPPDQAANPQVKVTILSSHDDAAFLSSTGKTGATSILPKQAVQAEVLSHIRFVASGSWSTWDARERRGRATSTERCKGKERQHWGGRLGRTPRADSWRTHTRPGGGIQAGCPWP
jgi:hypothetical protein